MIIKTHVIINETKEKINLVRKTKLKGNELKTD